MEIHRYGMSISIFFIRLRNHYSYVFKVLRNEIISKKKKKRNEITFLNFQQSYKIISKVKDGKVVPIKFCTLFF